MTAPAQHAGHAPRTVFRARLAVSNAFLVMGIGLGLWAVHIPLIEKRLGIDPATIGLALLAMATGAILSMPLTGLAIAHFGSRRPAAVLAIVFTILLPAPMLAESVWFLLVSLFVLGLAIGSLDVSVNVQALEIETARGKPTMSSFHGFFSVGSLIGALIGAAAIAAGLGDGTGAAIASAAFFLTAVAAAPYMLPAPPGPEAGPRFALPGRAVVGLGFLAFLAFAIEGAITDWSTLYLTSVKEAAPTTAALGYAAFALTMSVFRLAGDPIVARIGRRTAITAGALLIAAGLSLVLASPWAALAAVGFGLCGVGCANIVPVIFSQAAQAPGAVPGVSVASVATLGYTGFLVAPPLLGFVGNTYGLGASLGLVLLMALAAAAIGIRHGR